MVFLLRRNFMEKERLEKEEVTLLVVRKWKISRCTYTCTYSYLKFFTLYFGDTKMEDKNSFTDQLRPLLYLGGYSYYFKQRRLIRIICKLSGWKIKMWQHWQTDLLVLVDQFQNLKNSVLFLWLQLQRLQRYDIMTLILKLNRLYKLQTPAPLGKWIL